MGPVLQLSLILVTSLCGGVASDDLKLNFLTIVFRHGDRAPDVNAAEHFPGDPYVNETFFPEGIGGLTNNGKKREYLLGQVIRKLYGSFLGGIYFPPEIIARSTDYTRTKMSLQLVLAGIYPPQKRQQWSPRLNWQPVVANYVPTVDDNIMIPEECPLYLEEFERVKKLPKFRAELSKFHGLMKNLTKWLGKEFTLPNDMFNLYHGLMAEKSMGLELPSWADDIFPYGLLWNGTILEYDIVNYNQRLKRLNGGALLRNITDSMLRSVAGIDKRKLTLLSGHETNIAALLKTLGLYEPHVPQYSSAIFVELLRGWSGYYVRVQYYLGIPPRIVEQVIPGCTSPCPLEDFISLLNDVMPTDGEMICPKSGKSQNSDDWKHAPSIADLIRRKLNHV